MVFEIFRTRYCAALVTALWALGHPVHAESLIQEFENLFERCRASIEANSAFVSEGLQSRDVPKRHARDWGMSSAQQAWASPGSDLYVLLTEWTSRDGTVRHLCDVRLANEEHVLRPIDQALLLRHFMIRQVELVGAQTHEIDKQLSPIPPMVNSAFLLSDRNPNGCIVTNTFAFSPDGKFFSAGSGEQAVKPCQTE